MSLNNLRKKVAYGLSDALLQVAPEAIISRRAPTANDLAPLAQIWVDVPNQDAYILVAIIANAAVWINFAGGPGSFSSLTVTPGPISLTGTTTINTTGAATTSIGSVNGASGITLRVGTGNFSLDGVAGSTYTIGASTVGGTITIGGTAQTGALTLGSSSGAQSVIIAGGSGASVVTVANVQVGGSVSIGTGMIAGTISIGGTAQTGTLTLGSSSGIQAVVIAGGSGAGTTAIANSQTGGSIFIGNGMTTGTLTIGGTGAQVGTIAIAPGIGAQIVNIGNNGTGIKTINIGAGAIDNIVTIGSTTGTASTTIQAGTSGIALNAGGNVSIDTALNNATSPAATVAINKRVGQATFIGFTTASTAKEIFTITNTLVTATSAILLTVSNGGANDAQMTLTQLEQSPNTMTVITQNNGTQALNGDVTIAFWVLN